MCPKRVYRISFAYKYKLCTFNKDPSPLILWPFITKIEDTKFVFSILALIALTFYIFFNCVSFY